MNILLGKNHGFESGLTLPEVLVALAIFSVLGLGMLEITSEVYYRQDLYRETIVATTLAQSKAEELLGAGYHDPRLRDPGAGKGVAGDGRWDHQSFLDPDHADRNNPLDSEGETEGARRFTRVWSVEADAPLPGLKTVTVLVGWHDARGRQHVVSQTFQVARLRLSVTGDRGPIAISNLELRISNLKAGCGFGIADCEFEYSSADLRS